MIHLPKAMLRRIESRMVSCNKIYDYDESYTICGYFNPTWHRSLAANYRDVTCGECLNIMRCDHDFIIFTWSKNSLRHKKCLFEFFTFNPKEFKSGEMIEIILSKLEDKEELDNLIFSGLRLFRWL